jgi:hypothetical protein
MQLTSRSYALSSAPDSVTVMVFVNGDVTA